MGAERKERSVNWVDNPKHHRGPQNEAHRRQAEAISNRLRQLPRELSVAIHAHSTHHDWDYTATTLVDQFAWAPDDARRYVEEHKGEIVLLARGLDDVL